MSLHIPIIDAVNLFESMLIIKHVVGVLVFILYWRETGQ
jgi:hypothetical protein